MALNSGTADQTASSRSRASPVWILCVTAVKILAESISGSGTPKEATGGVLGWSGGTVLVAIAGAILIGVAAYQAYKGLAKFLDDAKTDEMSLGVVMATPRSVSSGTSRGRSSSRWSATG